MFDELDKYTERGHFILKQTDVLSKVCNAPSNKSGVYLVYALKKSRVGLIYIGCSGKKKDDGSIFIRKAGLGGMKDRLINGHQFGKIPRRISWISSIKEQQIDALDIYWYATHNTIFLDCPRAVEKTLLNNYYNLYGCLPIWNKEL
ncbi:MAG: hypothetical protein EOP46_02585 [Sphingobacteriaceae bacterium]|nr:MAG: hypothetical protein EOP46_02585 [Sphingobacteriaceae bacterium]